MCREQTPRYSKDFQEKVIQIIKTEVLPEVGDKADWWEFVDIIRKKIKVKNWLTVRSVLQNKLVGVYIERIDDIRNEIYVRVK